MKTKTHQDLCWHLPLLVAVFIQLWPIVFMVFTSLKDMDQIFQATLNPLPLPPTLNNYLTVLGNFPLFTYIYNTFFIAAFVTVFKVLTSVLAAFAFIYYDFKYKETVFNSMLLTFFIPITVLIMPNYLLMSRLDLLNTPWGVMLPQFVDGMGVFLMRQTMRGIPKPLLEAAVLDNAGPLQQGCAAADQTVDNSSRYPVFYQLMERILLAAAGAAGQRNLNPAAGTANVYQR